MNVKIIQFFKNCTFQIRPISTPPEVIDAFRIGLCVYVSDTPNVDITRNIFKKKIYDVDYMEGSCNICIYSVVSVYKLLFKNA